MQGTLGATTREPHMLSTISPVSCRQALIRHAHDACQLIRRPRLVRSDDQVAILFRIEF